MKAPENSEPSGSPISPGTLPRTRLSIQWPADEPFSPALQSTASPRTVPFTSAPASSTSAPGTPIHPGQPPTGSTPIISTTSTTTITSSSSGRANRKAPRFRVTKKAFSPFLWHSREEVRVEELEAVGAADDAARFHIDREGGEEASVCPLGLPLLSTCPPPAELWTAEGFPADY